MTRILIAEDEARITSFVQKGLIANGFTTTVVGDGESTLQHALGDRFDLLVLARVRLRLRRTEPITEPTVLDAGTVSLDLRTRRADVDGTAVDLTAREFALLELFLRHRGQVLSREQILSHVWGYDFDPGSNIVDVYVRALRRKVGAARIRTARGMGYAFDVTS